MSDNECIENNSDTGENEAVNIFNSSADKSNSTNSDEDYSINKWNQHKKSRNQDNISEGYEINDRGHRRRSMKHCEYSPKLDKNNDDKKVLNLWNESGSDSEAECVPNGNKAIECFICGEQLAKIYKLRQHMQMHARAEYYEDKRLELSVIYTTLNPHQRNIETKIIRDFLVSEIQAKRYSQFYGILSEASLELHISDSETESDATIENDLQIPKNNYKCDICQTNYNRRYKALFHQKAMHSNCNLYIECDYCGRQYIGIELLIHHMKTQCESDEKPITCVERFKQYLLKVNLEQFESLAQARKELKAQRLTTAQKIYTCDKCQKTFTRSEHLTRHRAVHLPEELKFECPVCFRRFNRKDNMRSHMKVKLLNYYCYSCRGF